MKNDALYREGRPELDADGKAILDRRRHAAIAKKTAYGRSLLAGAWVHNEFAVVKALYAAGGDVPQPLACLGNTILMAFVGGEQRAAPTLHEARPSREEAAQAAPRLLATIERLLAIGRVHGDLSAYNVLWWDSVPWVIDFPQAVDAWNNPHAYELLCRDLTRLGQFFRRHHVAWDGPALAETLWLRYIGIPAEEMLG
jgi:RIO kinase 1